jgi:hypothetical protein
MGEARSAWASEPVDDQSRPPRNSGEGRLGRSGRKRARASLVLAVALLVPGTMAVAAAAAQDEPPKVEAPKSAPPPAPELPVGLESAPQDVQKKDAAPVEKQKAAPTAPNDQEKAPPAAPADTQKEAPAAAEDATKKPASADTPDARRVFELADALSTRYRFVERYGIEEDPNRPQLITQYRVGVIETTKYETDRAQGAPERNERSRLMLYVERAAKVGRLGELTDLMRRYDAIRFNDLVKARPLNPPLLKGLTIWYHRRPPLKPQIFSLTEGRGLRDDEYILIEQDVNIPNLIAFFPRTAQRVGDTWEIPPAAVQDISGRLPDGAGFELTGTLHKVSKSEDGKNLIAQIGVEGQFDVMRQPSAFKALIDFVFQPRGVAIPAGVAKAEGASKVVEATGAITVAKLAHVKVAELPGSDGRLKQRVTVELTLERRPLALEPGEKGVAVAALPPQPPPTATQENSWVMYDDPAGRFSFRHPQELAQYEAKSPIQHAVDLGDFRPSGAALLGVMLPSNRVDTERDLRFFDAKHFQAEMEKEFAPTKDQDRLTWGAVGWLEDEDWKARKRKVFRMEGRFTPEKGGPPVYIDLYLVSDLNSQKSFTVEAWMGREGAHVAYRNDVEDVIRSFQWTPSEKRSPAPAAAPATTTAPAAAPAAAPEAGATPASPETPPVAPATAPNAPQQ